MASLLWSKTLTLTKSTHCFASLTPVRPTQLSPPSVQKTIVTLRQSVTIGFPTGPSPTVSTRRYCVPGNWKEEKGSEEEQSEMDPMKRYIKELYNTSQDILIGCVGDFSYAHLIASTLGDASKIVVISQCSCAGELEMMYENAHSHMLDLTKLGATIYFNVDFAEFHKDSRINHMYYDCILLDGVEWD